MIPLDDDLCTFWQMVRFSATNMKTFAEEGEYQKYRQAWIAAKYWNAAYVMKAAILNVEDKKHGKSRI